MTARFRIQALEPEPFAHLFPMDDAELAERGVRRLTVDADPGYPCRVSLEDARVGDRVLLLQYDHHRTASPYRASGPIFIREHAASANPAPGAIPEMLTRRPQSLRAYDSDGLMVAAVLAFGQDVAVQLNKLFERPDVAYVHLHNAGPGCFNCAAVRVGEG